MPEGQDHRHSEDTGQGDQEKQQGYVEERVAAAEKTGLRVVGGAFVHWTNIFNFTNCAIFLALLFNVYTGVWGMNDVSRKWRMGLLAIGFVLAVIGVWQSINQSSENERLIANVTGGNSYAAVIPQTHDPNLSLQIFNRGDSIISGVSVVVRPPNEFSVANWPAIEIGTLPPAGKPNFGKQLPLQINPDPDKSSEKIEGEKVSTYTLYMTAQNGLVVEVLQFRKGHNCLPMAFRYKIEKPVIVRETKDSITMTNSHLEGDYNWSDDLGDGKCKTTP